jgi:xanthine/uracil/vitamin C permease (AzgA family)
LYILSLRPHADGRSFAIFIVTVIVSILLAAALVFAAVRKLSHRPEIVATYARVGVPEERLNHLAVILLAGAAGLLLGLAWAPIGVAAAIGLVAYFALAVVAHLRAGDAANLPTPVTIELIAIAALVLRLAT